MPAIDLDVAGTGTAFSGLEIHLGMDEVLMTAQANDLDHSQKGETFEATPFGSETKNTLVGVRDGTGKVKGFSAMAHGMLGDTLEQRFGRQTPVQFWYALEGLAALNPIVMQPSRISDKSIKAQTKNAVEMDFSLEAAGAINQGYILLSPDTLLDGASGVGPDDTNLVPTTFGGAATLYVWSMDNGTTPSVTVTLKHASDTEGPFTTLGSPIVMSGVGAKRIKIPSTTTINEIVHMEWAVTGTPDEVQVMGGFARSYDRSL